MAHRPRLQARHKRQIGASDAQFYVEVDGTDGDMRLEPVTAQFWHTSVTTRGGVEGKAGTKGKIFSLDVSVTRAWPASSRFPLDLTDFKSFLLGAGDLFFKKKNVGAVIPIKIEGTKDSPSFGLNL